MTSPAADRNTSRPSGTAEQNHGRPFYKYAFWLLAVLAVLVVAHRGIDAWSSYQEQRALLMLMQRQQAEAAAIRVGQFMREIETQMRWLLQLPTSASTLDEWHLESVRVLRQVPAITEIARIDAEGREQVRVSRITVDVVGGQADLSRDPKFVQAVASKHYYSAVYFRRDSEPYMTLAIAGARAEYGVVAAEVNLKFIWDVLSEIKAASTIFVIDTNGRLIAHPDISLVLRNIDLSGLTYVQPALAALRAKSPHKGIRDQQALTMYAPVSSLGWALIVCPSTSAMPRSARPFCIPHDTASHPDTAKATFTRFVSYRAQTIW
jgi:hypothetical protein